MDDLPHRAEPPVRVYLPHAEPTPPLLVGRVLGRTFSTWARNAIPFSVISLVVHLPLLAYMAWLLRDDATLIRGSETWDVLRPIVGGVLDIVMTAAITYGVLQQLRGRPAPFGAVVRTGLRRLFPAFGAGVPAAILIHLPFFLADLLSSSVEATGLLMLPASVAFFMLTTALWVAVPVAVIEGMGIKALRRSITLTRGSRWRILGVGLVLAVLGVGLSLLLGVRFGVDDRSLADVRRAVLVDVGLTIFLIGPLASVAAAIGYHDLRVGKEGADVEDLARVFE